MKKYLELSFEENYTDEEIEEMWAVQFLRAAMSAKVVKEPLYTKKQLDSAVAIAVGAAIIQSTSYASIHTSALINELHRLRRQLRERTDVSGHPPGQGSGEFTISIDGEPQARWFESRKRQWEDTFKVDEVPPKPPHAKSLWGDMSAWFRRRTRVWRPNIPRRMERKHQRDNE